MPLPASPVKHTKKWNQDVHKQKKERSEGIVRGLTEATPTAPEQDTKRRVLFILRGVPGAGKTQVARVLLERLGTQAFRANLDDYAPANELKRFEELISRAMEYQYVVGELYSGRDHTSDPAGWVDKFKNDYDIHSFVLDISEERGYLNACDSRHTSHSPPSRSDYSSRYRRFYEWQRQNLFASRAGVPEHRIDAENCDWERIAVEVLKIGLSFGAQSPEGQG
jgi:hypothetical protein